MTRPTTTTASTETRSTRRAGHVGVPLLTIAEVARRLGVDVRHIRRLVAERRIPYIKWGHLLRFDPADLDTWIQDNRHPPAHPRRGLWSCTGVYTDTQRPRDSVFERDRDVPAPFDVLEDFRPGLDNHAYRPPRSAHQTPAANPRIHVHDNGRFVITGLLLDRDSGGVHGGTWEMRDDLLVIGFDNLDRNHAVQIQQHAPQAPALTWERPDRRTDLYDLRLGWHDNGIDIAFSSNVAGYATTCVKLTHTP